MSVSRSQAFLPQLMIVIVSTILPVPLRQQLHLLLTLIARGLTGMSIVWMETLCFSEITSTLVRFFVYSDQYSEKIYCILTSSLATFHFVTIILSTGIHNSASLGTRGVVRAAGGQLMDRLSIVDDYNRTGWKKGYAGDFFAQGPPFAGTSDCI